MPEIIIQPDGSMLIPRGDVEDNQFFCLLLQDMTHSEEFDALLNFFSMVEDSETIMGEPGLCG